MGELSVVEDNLPEFQQKLIDDFLPEDPPIEGMTQGMVSFVDYLIIFRGNRTKAYKEAGYAVINDNVAAVSGHNLLKKRKVQRLLAWRLNQLFEAEQIEVRQRRVIRELNRLAYSSLSDFCKWDESGVVTFKSMDDLTHDALAAIKKIKCVRTVRYDKDGNETVSTTMEIEQHDKKGALDMLARASKLVGEKGAASVPITVNMNFGEPVKTKVVSEQ